MKKLLLIVFTLLTLGLMSSCDDKQSTDNDDVISALEGKMWTFEKQEICLDGDWFECEEDEEFQYELTKIYFSQGNATAYFKNGKSGIYPYSFIDGYLNIEGMNIWGGYSYNVNHDNANTVVSSKISKINKDTMVIQYGEKKKWDGDREYFGTVEFHNHIIYKFSQEFNKVGIVRGYYIVNGIAYVVDRLGEKYFYDTVRVTFKAEK